MCIFTNGYVRETTRENRRRPVIVKVRSGGHVVVMPPKLYTDTMQLNTLQENNRSRTSTET